MLVEDSFVVSNQTEEYLTTWSVVSTIEDSSAWVIPEFPAAGTSILVISVILTVTVLGIKRRLAKSQSLNNN
jgi:hypothetical protein